MDQRREPLPRRMIPGIRKAASVMALGFDSFKTYEGAAGMLDAYVAAGGNVIDTGWVYGHGVPEGFFGQWQSSLKEWDTSAPADVDPTEIAKVKSKLESAKVRLANQGGLNNKEK